MPELENIKKLSAPQLSNGPIDPLEAQRQIAEERSRVLADPLARHQTYVDTREEKLLGPLKVQERVMEARREHLVAQGKGIPFKKEEQSNGPQEALIHSVESRTGYPLKRDSPLMSSVEASVTKEIVPQEISQENHLTSVQPKRVRRDEDKELEVPQTLGQKTQKEPDIIS